MLDCITAKQKCITLYTTILFLLTKINSYFWRHKAMKLSGGGINSTAELSDVVQLLSSLVCEN